MRLQTNQSGFSIVEAVIVLAVVAVLGLVGYGVYNRQNTSTNTQTASSHTGVSNTAAVPAISSTSDLDKASAILTQTDPTVSNASDSNQLDSQLASF